MNINNSKFRSIFVRADDPKFMDDRIETTKELIDLEALNIAEIRDEYIARQSNYDTTPFDPSGKDFRIFPGGYTVWSGFPGSGKTTLLRQLACHLMHKGKAVFVASLEEYPIDVFYRHAIVATGNENPTQHNLESCVFHWAEKLRLWGSDDMPAPHQKILAAIRVLAKQGVKHAIIDSLMCLDVANGDLEGQRLFSNALKQTVKSTGVHVHLVAHPRKIISTDQAPDINDVAGSADIGRLADNVIFVRRNKDEAMSARKDVTPMCISVLKHRHYDGGVGNIAGWFDRRAKQFKSDQFDSGITPYLPEWSYTEPSEMYSSNSYT